MIVDSGKDPNGVGEMKQISVNEGCQAPCVNSGASLLPLRSCDPRLKDFCRAQGSEFFSASGLISGDSGSLFFHVSSMALHG